MSGHRHAALALYRLGAADQDLILAELPDTDQARLRGYLAELAELGFDHTLPPPQVLSPVVHTPASAREQLRAFQSRRGRGAPACIAVLVEAMAPRLGVHAPPAPALRARMSLLFGKVRAWTR